MTDQAKCRRMSSTVLFVPSTSNMRIFSGLLFMFLITTILCLNSEMSPGVMGKIKAGFELAGKFLGFDEGSGLAQMVSQTFSGKSAKPASDANNNIFSGFLRLLGLDTKKLSAIAVNAIIFVAQLISTTLSRPAPSQVTEARQARGGTPIEWMLNNSNIANMIGDVTNKDLPNNIVEYIKERGLDENTDCIQLLMCKSAPMVWGMQDSLNTTKKVPKGSKALFANLPTMDDFTAHGDACEKKHPYCLIYY